MGHNWHAKLAVFRAKKERIRGFLKSFLRRNFRLDSLETRFPWKMDEGYVVWVIPLVPGPHGLPAGWPPKSVMLGEKIVFQFRLAKCHLLALRFKLRNFDMHSSKEGLYGDYSQVVPFLWCKNYGSQSLLKKTVFFEFGTKVGPYISRICHDMVCQFFSSA